jgi:hypothetical protein
MRFFSATALVLLAAFFASGARAGTIAYNAFLDPLQEVPPHNTPGFGEADLTLDPVSGVVTITGGSYSDLLAGATAVTINDAAVGSNGPVAITLTLDTPGNTSGTFSGGGTLTADQITDMIAGNTYVNIRDSVFPIGEIRGQIAAAAPEPAGFALTGVGLALAALVRARTKRGLGVFSHTFCKNIQVVCFL